MSSKQIIEAARRAQLRLKSDGHALEAESVHRLILSRISANGTNKSFYSEMHRCRALLARALDAMSRRDPDGISTTDWDKVIADITAELGKATS